MMTRMRTDERGVVIVVAMIAMAIMLVMGVATLAFVNSQQRHSGRERVGESSFDLANGAVKAQMFLLSRNWPSSAAKAYPSSCTSAAGAANCPVPATLATQFTGTDFAGAAWTTTVQDNGPPVDRYYKSAAAAGQPTYDASGPAGLPDGKLWIKAKSVARGQTRTVVTLIQADEVEIPFPGNLVTAGRFATSNKGRKVILDTNGSSYTNTPGTPGGVAVRCKQSVDPNCLVYQPSKGQISPPTTIQQEYPNLTAVSRDELAAMRGIASSKGTYYATGCPPTLTGETVFIESANCTYTGGTYNTLASPGMVVMGSGKLTLLGNSYFNGLIYSANLLELSDDMVILGGTTRVIGAITIDHKGGLMAGSSATNLAFNGNVMKLAKGYASANPVKGAWRELAQSG
jgi:Tfp pilus assembly protein PilX